MATLDQIIAAQIRTVQATPTAGDIFDAIGACVREARARGAENEVAALGNALGLIADTLIPSAPPAEPTDEEVAKSLLEHIRNAAPAAPSTPSEEV